MKKINDGGPAFPKQAVLGPDEDHPNRTTYWEEGCSGLTKREWFAGKAIEGILSGCPQGLSALDIEDKTIKAWVGLAHRIADAMLKEALTEEKKG